MWLCALITLSILPMWLCALIQPRWLCGEENWAGSRKIQSPCNEWLFTPYIYEKLDPNAMYLPTSCQEWLTHLVIIMWFWREYITSLTSGNRKSKYFCKSLVKMCLNLYLCHDFLNAIFKVIFHFKGILAESAVIAAQLLCFTSRGNPTSFWTSWPHYL